MVMEIFARDQPCSKCEQALCWPISSTADLLQEKPSIVNFYSALRWHLLIHVHWTIKYSPVNFNMVLCPINLTSIGIGLCCLSYQEDDNINNR